MLWWTDEIWNFKFLAFGYGYNSSHYLTIVTIINMRNLIKKVREILTILIIDWIKEFMYELPDRFVAKAEPSNSKNAFYTLLRQRRRSLERSKNR